MTLVVPLLLAGGAAAAIALFWSCHFSPFARLWTDCAFPWVLAAETSVPAGA